MLIEISGFDNGKEHLFKIESKLQTIYFWIDGNSIPISNSYQDIIMNLDNYCKELDINFKKRHFFKHFSKFTDNIAIENMIRAFAVISPFLNLEFYSVYCRLGYKEIKLKVNSIENLSIYFSNQIFIDCDDCSTTQSNMYFLRKKEIENNYKAVEYLYKCGLLQKLKITEDKENAEFFYVPFVFDKSNKQTENETWERIQKDISLAIQRKKTQ